MNTPDEWGIYTRVSTERQAMRTSPDVQLAANQEWALSNLGFNIPEQNIYREPGRTGASLDKRPVMRRVLEQVEAGRLRGVIFHSLDRTARNLDILFYVRWHFSQAGARGMCVVENGLDITTVDFQELVNLLFRGLQAQMELEDLTRRMKSGREARMQAGMASCGGVDPYGLKRVRYATPGGQSSIFYEPNPDEVRICHTIKDLLLSGLPCNQIAAELERLRIPPASLSRKRRAGRWGASQVHRILSDDIRRGAYRRGRLSIPVPAVFDNRDQTAIDERLAENTALYRHQRKHDYLLTGKMKCGLCGYTYCGGTSTNHYGSIYRFYRCALKASPRRYQTEARCTDSQAVKADVIEAAIWEQVIHLLTAPNVLEDLAGAQVYDVQAGLLDRIEAVKRDIQSIQADIDGLIMLAARDRGQHYERISQLLDAKDAELVARRKLLVDYELGLKQGIRRQQDLQRAGERVEMWRHAVRRGRDLPFEKRRGLVQAVIDHIQVKGAEFGIYVNLLDIHAAKPPWITLTLPQAVARNNSVGC